MKIEDYLEYEFLSKQYRDLMNVQHSIRTGLVKKPMDIKLNASLVRVTDDINSITPIIQHLGIRILEGMEVKYDLDFKFLIPPIENKKDIVFKTEK